LTLLRFDFRLERVCKRNLIKVLGIGLEQWRTLRKFVDGILEIFIGSLFVDDKTHLQPVAKSRKRERVQQFHQYE
jgi:hypothetical protein